MSPDPKPFRRGLIVGKFSPLHAGHEWLIRQAEAECEQLVLLSWSKPEFPNCDSKRRRRWLQSRFAHLQSLVLDDCALALLAGSAGVTAPPLPDNGAPDIESRVFVGWVCEHLLKYLPDVVFTSEDYGDGFADQLTRYFLLKNPDTQTVVHRCIDKARSAVPISGTALRQDPHSQRAFLAPEVYADFVDRVVLLGGESTGKSTLAKALAQTLSSQWVPEYGRELWEAKGGALDYADMLHIAQTQVAREQQIAGFARRYLICDSSPLTTYFYSLAMFGQAEPALAQLAERRYSQVFLCAAGFDFVQDGTRRDDSFRLEQQRWYQQQLVDRNIPFVVLHGSVAERVQQARQVLEAMDSPLPRPI